MKNILAMLTIVICFAFVATAAVAQDNQDTMERIKAKKQIDIGYRSSSIPLSFATDDSVPQGYSIDISERVAKKIMVDTGLSDLKVVYHSITAQDRIEMIQNGTIDFECSATTITPERQKLVSFSRPFYVTALTYLYDETKIPEIESVADLRGKTVALIKGTTGEAFLKAKDHDEHLGIKFLIAEDNSGALDLLERGQVAAIFQDDVQLAGLRGRSAMAGQFIMPGKSEHYEPYGCAFSLGDKRFELLINTVLVEYAKSGAMNDSYKKWFVYPIESLGGINLKLPMSKGTREARDALVND